MELELLYNKMNEINKEVESNMGNQEMPFAKSLYALTNGLSREDLFLMTDKDLIKLIQKIQIKEG